MRQFLSNDFDFDYKSVLPINTNFSRKYRQNLFNLDKINLFSGCLPVSGRYYHFIPPANTSKPWFLGVFKVYKIGASVKKWVND